MARGYRMTPKRKAALRKAQAASARKRKGKGKGKLAAANRSNSRLRTGIKAAVGAAAVGMMAYGAHRTHGQIRRTVSEGVRERARIRVAGRQEIRNINAARDKLIAGNRRRVRRSVATEKLRQAAKGTSGSGKRQFVSSRVMVGYSQRGAHNSKRTGAPRSNSTKGVFLRAKFMGNTTARLRQKHRKVLWRG